MTKRYHVEVKVREGDRYVWRPTRPTDGEPYIFTWDEASRHIEVYSIDRPGTYRMVEVKS